jgi:hypothetical protein
MPALTRITPNDGASTVTAIDACPRCNASDDDAAPRPPAGFRTNADKRAGGIDAPGRVPCRPLYREWPDLITGALTVVLRQFLKGGICRPSAPL